MPWVPDVLAPFHPTGVGWFPEAPETKIRVPQLGWLAVHTRVGSGSGVGHDEGSSLALHTASSDAGAGHDQVAFDALSQIAIDAGAGQGGGTGRGRFPGADSGVGWDSARLGVYGFDNGVGRDHAGVMYHLVGSDGGAGDDLGGLTRAAMIGHDDGVGSDLLGSLRLRSPSYPIGGAGSDSGVGAFTPQPPTTVYQITATTTVTIPVWCRYIDAIAVGGGAGGNTGEKGVLARGGNGGGGGAWAWWTYERGVDVPWTTITVTATVGAGGGGRTNGTASSVAIAGATTMIGAGGTWNNGIGGDRDGQPPYGGNTDTQSGVSRSVLHQGITCTGGSWSNTDTANIPGAGGRGGGGAVWPLTPGSGKTGARGQVWLRFRM